MLWISHGVVCVNVDKHSLQWRTHATQTHQHECWVVLKLTGSKESALLGELKESAPDWLEQPIVIIVVFARLLTTF